jgi:hypothetical protein
MKAKSLPWFRMYTDFLEDSKMIGIAFEDQRHFIGILALKSSGLLDQNCTPEMMTRIVAQKLWIDHAIINDVKRRLMTAELIDIDWQPIAWNKRQCVSDHDASGAERQRKFREKKAEEERNALRNGDVTPPEVDLDLDKERDKDLKTKPKSKAISPSAQPAATTFTPLVALIEQGVPEQVAKDHLLVRKQKKQPLTQSALSGMKREADKAGVSLADAVGIAAENGWASFKAEWFQNARGRGGGNAPFDPTEWVNRNRTGNRGGRI